MAINRAALLMSFPTFLAGGTNHHQTVKETKEAAPHFPRKGALGTVIGAEPRADGTAQCSAMLPLNVGESPRSPEPNASDRRSVQSEISFAIQI
jgi:hypothetical protein